MIASKPDLKPFNNALQFHLLRHFIQLGSSYAIELSQQLSIPVSYIYKESELVASKFHPAFATNPLELFDRLTDTITEQWNIVQSSDNKIDYQIAFDKLNWPQGIGENSVIATSEMNNEQRSRIKLEKKDKFVIQILHTSFLPVTNEMIIVVSSYGQVITAFPGQWLPPLDEKVLKNWVFLTTGLK